MRTAFVVSLLLALAAHEALAQEPKGTTSQPPRPTSGGSSRTPGGQMRISANVYIGERAPDFELTDWRGRQVKLSSFRGHPMLLAFSERREDLAKLRLLVPQLRDLDVVVVGICADKPQTLRSFVERDSIPFEMLSDVTREVSAIYGLLDRARTWVQPGFLVLDPTGVVKIALLGRLPATDQIADLTRFAITGLP